MTAQTVLPVLDCAQSQPKSYALDSFKSHQLMTGLETVALGQLQLFKCNMTDGRVLAKEHAL